MTDEAMGRVSLVIKSKTPNPGPITIVLRLTTENGTATGKGDIQPQAHFTLAWYTRAGDEANSAPVYTSLVPRPCPATASNGKLGRT